jgi:hypothetical protein
MVVASLCLTLACARDAQLDQQIDRVGQSLIEADTSGAMRCAPRQLAIATSHLEFAELEQAQGFTARAEYHLQMAEQHAEAAKLLSPAEHCAPQHVPRTRN